MNISVVIADDHPIFLFGLRNTLARYADIEIVATASDGREALDLLETSAPDLLILDIIMPQMDGIETARLVREKYPSVRILVLSSDSSEQKLTQLVGIGINGFVSKNAGENEIVQAIRSVAAGYEYYGADIASLIRRIHNAKNLPDSLFTDRELDIIKLSCQGLRYKEIADCLKISERTVETHKNNIFRKLGISSSVELVIYAIQNGIISI